MSRRERQKLVSEIGSEQMVRVERRPKYADNLGGFIIAVGAKWALIANIMDGGFSMGTRYFDSPMWCTYVATRVSKGNLRILNRNGHQP